MQLNKPRDQHGRQEAELSAAREEHDTGRGGMVEGELAAHLAEARARVAALQHQREAGQRALLSMQV